MLHGSRSFPENMGQKPHRMQEKGTLGSFRPIHSFAMATTTDPRNSLAVRRTRLRRFGEVTRVPPPPLNTRYVPETDETGETDAVASRHFEGNGSTSDSTRPYFFFCQTKSLDVTLPTCIHGLRSAGTKLPEHTTAGWTNRARDKTKSARP